MVSGIFLGYEMKHLITGETVNIDAYKIVENALSMEEGVKDINSIKIVSIGTDKYLGIVKVDYLDSFTDLEIIDLNKKIEESVKTTDSRFSHLYLIPA
jgi:divalent metal cation (Fe/Co/Zn/Cd) transporter